MPATPKAELITRKQQKSRQARLDAKARRACVDAVWTRAGGCCEQCGVTVYRPGSGVVFLRYGHVHEVRPRSLGGSPHDVSNVALVCTTCHARAHRLKVSA